VGEVDSNRKLRGWPARISGRTARRQYSSRAYCSNCSNNGTDIIVVRVVEEQKREIVAIFLQ
jgi:hypothetical protein